MKVSAKLIAAIGLAAWASTAGGCDRPTANSAQQPVSSVYHPPAAVQDGLTTTEQANLVMQELLSVSCLVAQIKAGDIHSADDTVYRQAEELDLWFDRTVRRHPETYPVLQAQKEGGGWTGVGWKSLTETYGYVELGRDMQLRANKTWGKTRRNVNGVIAEYPYKQMEVSFCSMVPDHVDILSTSGDSTSGWLGVQYRLRWAPTKIARQFTDAGLPRPSFPVPRDIQGSATLQRTNSGTWNVQLQH